MKSLRQIFQSLLRRDSFVQNTLLMSSASAWGILIQFLAAPILSRIYSPEVYGVFAVFGTFLNVVMTLITLGFNRALLLPREESSMRSLLRLSILSALVGSAVVQIIFGAFGRQIAAFFSADSLGNWVLWVAPLALLTALDQYVVSWTMQARAFRSSSVASVPINAGSKAFNIAYGKYVTSGVEGLIFTHILSAVLRIGVHLGLVLKRVRQILFVAVSKEELKSSWREYIDYPKYIVWGQLLNQLSNYIPVLLLPVFLLNTSSVGYYTYAVMILELPIRLLGAGLGPVFLQESAERWKTQPDMVRQKTWRLFKTLLLIALPGVVALSLIGAPLFAMVFSDTWRSAGEAAAVLAISYLFRYISVPLSGLFNVTRNEKAQLYFQVILFAARLAGIAVPGLLGGGFIAMMHGFALANGLAYLIFSLWIFRLIDFPMRKVIILTSGIFIGALLYTFWRFF